MNVKDGWVTRVIPHLAEPWAERRQEVVMEGAGALFFFWLRAESRLGLSPSPVFVSHLAHFSFASIYSVRIAQLWFQIKYQVLYICSLLSLQNYLMQ